MSTVPRMRSLLRRSAVITSLVAIVFFCSCERHHPDELAAEGPVKAEPGTPHHAAAVEKEHGAKAHVSPAPTPAQFFPESTPH